MIDLHAHVLPGLDDGPATWDEAVALVEAAQREGITTLVVTPHFLPGVYEPAPEEVLDQLHQLQVLVSGIRLLPGAEVYLDPQSAAHIAAGKAFTLADRGRHVLVELPMAQVPLYTRQALSDLQAAGLASVLAHPERNLALTGDRRVLEELRETEILFQVDAASIAGDFGPQVQRSSRSLLQWGYVDFVASDCHSLRKRPPRMQAAAAAARAWGWDITPLMTDNPATILGDGRELGQPSHLKSPSLLRKLAAKYL